MKKMENVTQKAKKNRQYKVNKNIIYFDRILFDSVTGNIHRISETTSHIISQLQIGANTSRLVQSLSERYAIPQELISSDVEVILSELIALNIVKDIN